MRAPVRAFGEIGFGPMMLRLTSQGTDALVSSPSSLSLTSLKREVCGVRKLLPLSELPKISSI